MLWNYFLGEGLGKNSQGISEPIKASLKFDKTGVGHDPAKEFTSSWWDDAYKQAANNVIIDSEQVTNSGLISSCAILLILFTQALTCTPRIKILSFDYIGWNGKSEYQENIQRKEKREEKCIE